MPTANYAFNYVTSAGTIIEEGGSVVLTYVNEPILPGDTVSYFDGTNTYFATYVSVSAEDEPNFVRFDSLELFFSNEVHNAGDSAPAFTAENFTPCFLTGTRISTPKGEVEVEALAIGGIVLAADGRAVPVRWIGRKQVSTTFLPDARRPIAIQPGALGDGLPLRTFRVTPDHALLIDGVLVQAGALINGTSIVLIDRKDLGDCFTVFHIETDRHEVIVADGVPAETFVDNVTRRRFDNYAEYEALYGAADPSVPEIALPRVKSARQLPQSIRERLFLRSGAVADEAA